MKSKKKKKSVGDQTLSNVDDKLLHMPISRDVTVESLTFKVGLQFEARIFILYFHFIFIFLK